MLSQILFTIGLILVFIGILVTFILIILSFLRERTKPQVRYGGVILLGPIPIVFGNLRPKILLLLLLTSIILILIALLIPFLWWNI